MLVDLLQGLDRQRFTQSVVRGTPIDNEGDYLKNRAVPAEVITARGLRRSLDVVGEFRSLFALIGTLRRLKPDIVHTHMAKAGVIGRIAAVLARVPVRVHTYHGHLLHGYFSPSMTRIVTTIERFLRLVTTHALVVGDTTRRDLLKARVIHEQRSSTILPAARTLQRHDRYMARTSLGLPHDGVIVGFVGRLTGIKRPDRFLRVAAAVPDATFVMVGNGPLHDAVARTASVLPNVRLLDWHEDIAVVLSAIDVLVLTSDNEGVPLSLIEAALIGVPVVAVDVGGVREIVEDGVTGIIVHDESQLAEAVSHLVRDTACRQKFGAQAKSFISKRCSLTTYLEAHATLYERLVVRESCSGVARDAI